MLRRNSAYSYLTDPSSHALDKQKSAKYTAENDLLFSRNNINLIRFAQDDNLYQSRRKNVKQSLGPATKSETVSNLGPPAKTIVAMPHNRLVRTGITQPKPPTPQAQTMSPKAKGSMSYQIQHRRSMIRSSLTDISIATQKETQNVANGMNSEHRTLTLYVDNSLKQFPKETPQSSRKISSQTSATFIKPDSDEEKSSEAVCSGDYVADAEDATVDDISSYTSDECWGEHEYFMDHGGQRRDAQTQTFLSGGPWYQSGDMFPFRKVQKRTETCQVQTTQYVAKSTEVCKRTTTTECRVRPSTCPAQFIAETTELSKSTRLTGCSSEPTTFPSVFGNTSTIECSKESTYCQSATSNQLVVPEPIKAILKPLNHNNDIHSKCTVTRGMALSMAASFLLFLGILWTGISVSLATHRIVMLYLHPTPPRGRKLLVFLKTLTDYLGLIAHWVWYRVYY